MFYISFGSFPFITIKTGEKSLGECNLFVLNAKRQVNRSGSDTVFKQSFNEDVYVGSIMKV